MSRSLNKVQLIGHLGKDPEIVTFANGDRVANLSLATSETWKDRQTGEVKERTEWHRITIRSKALVALAEKYFKKGAQLYVQGGLQTREYEKDGVKKYSTEIVLSRFGGEVLMLDKADKGATAFDADVAALEAHGDEPAL